jgi:N-formylglutamate amidohydrolase
MPGFAATGPSEGVVDFALGDRFGRSCAPAIVERVEALLRRQGFQVARNRPYAGGHITTRYGRPETGVHALQLELRRGLFMEERTREPYPASQDLERGLRELLADLALFVAEEIAPRPAAAE